MEEKVLDLLLTALKDRGLVKAGGRQRTDSTRVLAFGEVAEDVDLGQAPCPLGVVVRCGVVHVVRLLASSRGPRCGAATICPATPPPSSTGCEAPRGRDARGLCE